MPVILTTKARTRISIQVAVVLGCLGAGSAFAPLAAFEIPQERSAATYLGALTEGNNYHVAARVRSDGNMLIFVVDTKYGKFQVDGVELTKVFIQELTAIDALEKISQSDTFAKSLGRSATAPIRYGANLIVNPVGTVGDSLSGVANMFDRATASLADPKADRATTADSLLGVDDARRELAVSLGVDPYTNFPPLAQKLTDVASATAAGGLSVKAALAVIPGGVAVIAVSSVSSIQSASDTLRDKTSAQIAQEVKATLLHLDVSPDTVARFVTNRAFTPADLLLTSRALARLNADNTQAFVDRAAEANSRSVAFFERRRAELLSERGRELGGIADFINVGGFALNRNRAGNVVALFPCDDIAWTAITERAVTAITNDLPRDGAVARKPILATNGAVTPMASREFQKLGWQVVHLK
jgi:hypothetical protein